MSHDRPHVDGDALARSLADFELPASGGVADADEGDVQAVIERVVRGAASVFARFWLGSIR